MGECLLLLFSSIHCLSLCYPEKVHQVWCFVDNEFSTIRFRMKIVAPKCLEKISELILFQSTCKPQTHIKYETFVK